MKRVTPFILIVFLLASCNGWIIQPLPGNPPTPFLPFTPQPSVFTATPVVIGVATASPTPNVSTLTPSLTPFAASASPTLVFTPTPTVTNTPASPASASIALVVLGCDTSIDILHGMGEVTNAYVTLKNTGGVPLTNITVTLLALDPGQQTHPDQTKELASLPVGYQVTMKLTADTTYRQETPIQVQVTSDQGTFPRGGAASCTDIGLLAPNPAGLDTPVPAEP